jgi:transcriptional regulator with XRE-family HTH domain
MTKELYTYIGQAIKESRRTTFKHKIITQSELAKVCGVTFQQIQKYEKASNKIPLDKLLTISKHVNKTLLDFLPADNVEAKRVKQANIQSDNVELEFVGTPDSLQIES